MTYQPVYPAGQPAPSFELTAVETERKITPRLTVTRGTVLLFHNHLTAEAARDVNNSVRKQYPLASDVVVASVVDLSSVPRLFHGMAQKGLKQAFEAVAKQVPAEATPYEYVVLLPDWKGEVTKAFGIKSVDKIAAIVVLDHTGMVAGSHQGDQLGEAALSFLSNC